MVLIIKELPADFEQAALRFATRKLSNQTALSLMG
jgi:hypothetical protein